MPSRALTVTLNVDHSKKFALLLPESPQSRTGLKEHILREAKNKFRNKAISSVFLQGGAVLADGDDLPENVGQVWVGKGEPYAGPHAPAPGLRSFFDREKSYIDDNAVQQLQRVAGLPGVRLAVGMPDLHPGNRFPIGCAIASEGVYPALIGSDVGCGIALYRLASTASHSRANPRRLAATLKGLDDPWSGVVSDWLARYDIQRVSEFDQSSLGTVGSGNHFAEICTPEKIVDGEVAESLNIKDGGLYLFVHTGSRGLGASILARETLNESNPYIPPDSPRLSEYLAEHDYAVKWAIANRDLVAHRIKECIFPSTLPDSDGDDHNELLGELELEKIIDVTHNSVTQHLLRVGGEFEAQNLWVHRKGAAPSDKGISPCPGSRGDFSWLLKPIGDGQHNAHSLAHGAGRRYGRQVLHTGTKINKSSLITTALGSEVICMDPDLLLEERPEAYKAVIHVVEDMEDQNICRGVIVFRPVVTYKVREGGENRK